MCRKRHVNVKIRSISRADFILIEFEKCAKHFSTTTRCKATNITCPQGKYHSDEVGISLREAQYHLPIGQMRDLSRLCPAHGARLGLVDADVLEEFNKKLMGQMGLD